MKSPKLFLTLCAFALLFTITSVADGKSVAIATVVDLPDTAQTNSFYLANRTPLEPSRLIALPIGSVHRAAGYWKS